MGLTVEVTSALQWIEKQKLDQKKKKKKIIFDYSPDIYEERQLEASKTEGNKAV
jgi:hypothetical protein